LAEAVSTPEQALYRMTIAELADRLSVEIGAAPALIIYGPLADGA
jgi:uroporphyrin-III C-methyltransferase